MAATYDDWKERAREHLAQGRPLDALTCFRHAARLRPRAPAPLVGIADALWRLGQPHDAIATWRELVARRPDHAPGWLAIAEAVAFVGDDAGAREAASHVAAAMPGDPRAAFIIACAGLADAATRDDASASLVDLVRADPAIVRPPHFAGLLARALAVDANACKPLREALAAQAAHLPLALFAEVVGFVAPDAARAAVDRNDAGTDADAMRMVALRIAGRAGAADGDAWMPIARRAAARHAESGATLVPDVPLAWSRRAAGHRGRVVVLVDTDHIDADAGAWSNLVGVLAVLGARIDLGFAAFGDAARLQSRLQDAALDDARVTQMPETPDLESARSLAASEPDILVDTVGLRRPLATLLAARPARRLLAIDGPLALTTPLVDAVVDAAPSGLVRALGSAIDAAVAAPHGALAPAARQAALAAAIDAHRNARHDEARAGYDALLADAPGYAPVLHLRGALRRELGDADAVDDFEAALAAAPRDAKSRVAVTQLLLARHRLDDARRVASAGLEDTPGSPALWRALGHVALVQQDGAAAVNAFAAAIAQAPLDAETHFNHGVALQMLRELGHAARAYQRALALEPALLDAHFNLGVVFDEMGEVDSSVAALEYVIERAPARAEAHRALLNVLARHARGEQWMRAFERFETACPDALGLVANALEYYQYRGDYARVHRYVDRLAQGDFKPVNDVDLVDSLEQLLYLMLFFDIAPGTQASLYATYDKAALHVYGPPLARTATRQPGRIRVGYLSADFREHVMGRMMLDVVRHHDRDRFEIRLYSTSSAEDGVTAAFRGAADAFIELSALGDDAAVKRIAEDDLDLLVDLSTHTRGARPAIMARKPARVAITHIASAGALGLSAVDFKLTDARADLPDNDRHYVETLLPMEGCAYPVRRMTPAAVHPYHRDVLGIAGDDIVIGAFVTPLKLSRRTTALWHEILERIPRAKLAFSPNADWLRDTYPAILAAAGIDPARAIVLPQGADEAVNLARYALVDFVLDPMPFGNVNGTIEPLNMGVPVVTLVGQTHGERTGFSILSHVGETRTIATSGKEYVDIAVRLAGDRDFATDVRASLRRRMAEPAVVDPRVYVRNLEKAYDAAMDKRGAGASGDDHGQSAR
jgi:predicted O-linked N-acetylglucosamine transferase (SPINDLY family)